MTLRKIITIDQDKCNGCGLCVPSCAEGAIQIVDGKARLISEIYCDGLGACLGDCPQGAITMQEREAEDFDAEAVEKYLAERETVNVSARRDSEESLPCGCPGTMTKTLSAPACASSELTSTPNEAEPSSLGNWPVQLRLVPVAAPYLAGARLLIAADCVPFALADFHRRLLRDRVLLIACPKLDDAQMYQEKLSQIFTQNDIKSIDVAFMEVPCCFGLLRLVNSAVEASGKQIPVALTKIGINGTVCESNVSEIA